MNIHEMHNMFRTLGQQNGSQLIRGILPESIDVYINEVITEKVKEEVLAGVRTTLQDSVNTQASTMQPINTFRNLYRSARYSINTGEVGNNKKVSFYNNKNGYHIINIPTVSSNITLENNEYKIQPMMFLGFSVEYETTLRGNAVACRLIGSDVLETTLRDYCNGASKDSPIVCLSSIPIIDDGIEKTGVISCEQLEIFTNSNNNSVKFLNIKYIKTPNVVKYDIELSKCVNCDLPDYTHFEIVERAVGKFFASVGGQTANGTVQQQRQ